MRSRSPSTNARPSPSTTMSDTLQIGACRSLIDRDEIFRVPDARKMRATTRRCRWRCTGGGSRSCPTGRPEWPAGPAHVHGLPAGGNHAIQRFRESLKEIEITNDSAASGNEDLAFAYVSSHGLFSALDQPDARGLELLHINIDQFRRLGDRLPVGKDPGSHAHHDRPVSPADDRSQHAPAEGGSHHQYLSPSVPNSRYIRHQSRCAAA